MAAPLDDLPEIDFPAQEPGLQYVELEHKHHYQMACNETTFVRFCVLCGETAYFTRLESWPGKWTYIRGEVE